MSEFDSTSRWVRVDDLMERAAQLAPEDREPFLKRECGGDLTLFQEVRSLLQHEGPGQALFDHLGDSLIGSSRPTKELPETPVGQRIGPYRIEAPLGDGGMGWVCRATDTRSGGPVAMKFLPPHLRSDARSTARFLEEAKVELSIKHDNVCEALEVGRDDELGPFIVMAFYEGSTLKTRLAAGAMAPDESIAIAEQVALGLGAAHQQGVVHRDIKPDNILVSSGGSVRVLDFGAAKQTDVSLTETGKILGTVTYMAPEQVTGEAVGPATDVWAVGVVLHEMLAGRHPFRERSLAATVRRLLTGAPDSLSVESIGGFADLRSIVRDALSRDPSGRPSATELATRLNALRAGRDRVEAPATPSAPTDSS